MARRKMSKKDLRRAALTVAVTVLALLAAGTLGAWRVLGYPDRRPAGPVHEAHVVVEKGTPLGEIARRLGERGLIEHPSWFRFYANEQGLSQKIRAGKYTLSSTMTPRQLLARLVEGVPVEEITVTLPEGKNLVQVADILDEAGVSSRDDVTRLARDAAFVRQLGVPGDTLEGYLFPDTYRFRPGTPAQKVLTQLVHRAHDVLAQLKAAHTAGAAALEKTHGLGDREIVLLASLVEKETARPEERPRIAGVFLNRLALPTFVPHLLQTDPTIVYGCTVPPARSPACQKFEGRIRRLQLDDKDNPYNTYTHEGLPPGPIANPGRAAIEAVLSPDKALYLYFVSKNDGTHQFSKTRSEHEAAVEKYQKHGGSGT
jgi:UPF0755 protein